jgi:hypothetical protein
MSSEPDPTDLEERRQREANKLQEPSHDLAQEVEDVSQDWQQKRSDEGVPGALAHQGDEEDEDEDEGSAEASEEGDARDEDQDEDEDQREGEDKDSSEDEDQREGEDKDSSEEDKDGGEDGDSEGD